MSKKILVVLTNPIEDREKEYNDWYNHIHLPDVLKVPGFVSAQRFKVMDAGEENRPYKYLAIYEVDTDDAHVLMDAYYKEAQHMEISDALDRSNLSLWVFSSITERVVKQ